MTLLSDLFLIVGFVVLLAAAALTIAIIGLVGLIFVLAVLGVALIVLSFALVDGKGLSWRS